MKNMTVSFLNRDFTPRISYPWSYINVRDYSWSAEGGPKDARLQFYGNELSVWEIANMMRCPVVIRDGYTASPRWWGYINGGTIYTPTSKTAFDLGEMSNNISVKYVQEQDSLQTDWAQDDDSVDEYGQKDIVLSLKDATDAHASAKRDTELELRKYPQIGDPFAKPGSNIYADVNCYGWWHTLDWPYYEDLDGLEQYIDEDDWYGREIGEDDRPTCAQAFQLDSAWDIYSIWIRIKKVGDPDEDVTVSLYSESGGLPNSQLASKTLTSDEFETYMQWIEFEMTSPYSASASTTYFIHCYCGGGIDLDNYYIIDGNASKGYEKGDFYLYWTDLSTWKYKDTMHMNFKVVGKSETTEQITDLISSAGEFFLDTDLTFASGVFTNQYRNGEQKAQWEMRQLLDLGNSNNKRLLATVLPNYHLKVYVCPQKFEKDYSFGMNKEIRDQNDTIIPNSYCPVGIWMKSQNLIPANVNLSLLSSPSHRFIEEARYEPATDTYTPTATSVNRGIAFGNKDSGFGSAGRFLNKFGGIKRG